MKNNYCQWKIESINLIYWIFLIRTEILGSSNDNLSMLCFRFSTQLRKKKGFRRLPFVSSRFVQHLLLSNYKWHLFLSTVYITLRKRKTFKPIRIAFEIYIHWIYGYQFSGSIDINSRSVCVNKSFMLVLHLLECDFTAFRHCTKTNIFQIPFEF